MVVQCCTCLQWSNMNHFLSKSPLGCICFTISMPLIGPCVDILNKKLLRLPCHGKCYIGCNCKDITSWAPRFDEWSLCFHYQILDCPFGFECLEISKGRTFPTTNQIPTLATWVVIHPMPNNLRCNKYLTTSQHGNG